MADQTLQSEMILYQTADDRTRIQLWFENKSIWLTQKLMEELLQKDVRTINEHVQNVLAEAELSADSVIRKFRITAADWKSFDTQRYSLEMILAVGYRVKSPTCKDDLQVRAEQRLSAQLATIRNFRRIQSDGNHSRSPATIRRFRIVGHKSRDQARSGASQP